MSQESLNNSPLIKPKMVKEHKEIKKNRNPFDDCLDQLEEYDEGCSTSNLMSSGE